MTRRRKLVFASSNQGKIKEVSAILPADYELLSAADAGHHDDIPETGMTFHENALIKAKAIREFTGEWSFADDSGLEVAALGGAPGVHSARYAGEPQDNRKNISKLLHELKDTDDRRARFVTIICLMTDQETKYFEGEVEGIITKVPSGNEGFGYDPVFIPEGETRTFAEMTPEEKNRISHRSRAVRAMTEYLENLKPEA